MRVRDCIINPQALLSVKFHSQKEKEKYKMKRKKRNKFISPKPSQCYLQSS